MKAPQESTNENYFSKASLWFSFYYLYKICQGQMCFSLGFFLKTGTERVLSKNQEKTKWGGEGNLLGKNASLAPPILVSLKT